MKRKKDENSTEDIGETLESKPSVYALFYASWCPHSQRFLPIFKAYARTNPEECLEILVDFREDLCDKYSVEYYPTVLFLKNGKVQKRLDATPGLGLTKEQLEELTGSK